jgi:hypothetical protein
LVNRLPGEARRAWRWHERMLPSEAERGQAAWGDRQTPTGGAHTQEDLSGRGLARQLAPRQWSGAGFVPRAEPARILGTDEIDQADGYREGVGTGHVGGAVGQDLNPFTGLSAGQLDTDWTPT